MTYESSEQSVAGGKPILLFRFASSIGEVWRLTSSEVEVVYGSYTYSPGVIGHEQVEIEDIVDVNALEIKLGRSNAIANQLIAGPIEGYIDVTVYRGHEGDYVIFWSGRLTSVTWDDDAIPTLRFEPQTSSMARVGKRRIVQRLCGLALYDNTCTVSPPSYRVSGTVTSFSGLDIVSSTFATKSDGWFQGGKIQVGNAVRLITAHTTNTITISRLIRDLEVGNSFYAWAGCDHLPTTCNTKFGNKLNFGGCEFLPVKNPFEGGIRY
jgi:uncharacterized phage protein (TIGR02218 family)